ncbi:MAG: hypothetical protein LBP28_02995 [Coriobacteriales bacterium]|nr:hypothetical protein [Coriobacteriales bacterium]
MEFFIAVIVVLVGLNIFFFLIFRGITLRLAKFAQMNVLRQAGIFDDLINKKQEQLQALRNEIAAAQAAQVEQTTAVATAQQPVPDFLDIKQGLYTSDSFASEYRIIRDNFQVDAEACVRESLARATGLSSDATAARVAVEAARARAAQGILDELTLDSAYELSTLASEAQLNILTEMFTPAQNELVREYFKSVDEFQSYRFLFWLKDYVFAHGDTVTVFTANPEEDFSSLDSRIVTEQDDSICEGIYVLSKGRKFDYSIRNREIVG